MKYDLSSATEMLYLKSKRKSERTIAKRKSDFNKLQRALTYAESIITTIPTPAIILYQGFKINTANNAFYKVFNVSADEAKDEIIYNLANGEWNIPPLKKLLEQILPQKNVFHNFEIEHLFRNAGHKIILVNARRIYVDDKNEPIVLLVFEDITEKRSIEAAVKRERNLVLENIPSGLMILDKKWRCIFCNKKLESILGKNILNAAGKDIWKIFADLVGSSFNKHCFKVNKSGNPEVFEQLFPHINAWFSVRLFSSSEGLSVYFEDITEHKKSEEKAEIERKKMFNLFINAPALICVLRGPDHIYELANKPYKKLIGLKRNLIGIPMHKAIPELKQQGFFEILDNVYKTGIPYVGKEIPVKLITTEKGKVKDVVLDVVFQPYTNSAGKVEGIISYASDITSLVNKRKQVEELSKQKDEFIGVASHELKTPVTSIKGYTQILQMRFKQEGNAKAVELLTRMDGQINKLAKLISDLLDATKIEGGKLQYHNAFFDFNDLVREIVEEMQQITHRHNIITKSGLTEKIYGDRDRIGQVITNLISNAIKYSPEKKEILITTLKDKNTITLCVQDFGIGIPKQKQFKIFDRFYRVSGVKEDTYPGMGLGLYISAEIIKRHKGSIYVKSVAGKGSTFWFTLPLKKPK